MSANSLGFDDPKNDRSKTCKTASKICIFSPLTVVQQWNAGNGSKINNFLILTAISLLGWIGVLMVKI